MEKSSRSSLIAALNKSVCKKEDGNRYVQDTCTLYTEKQPSKQIDLATEFIDYEIILNQGEFSMINLGLHNFIITEDKGYMAGKQICIKEIDGFKLTGKILVKQIHQIRHGAANTPIREGYCVISWIS